MRSKEHKINWNRRTFLAVEKEWKRRRIKESIFLNSLNPSTEIDASKLMNPEKGMEFEMAECMLERVQPYGQTSVKEGHIQRHTKISEKNSKAKDPPRSRKMTYVIYYVCLPL